MKTSVAESSRFLRLKFQTFQNAFLAGGTYPHVGQPRGNQEPPSDRIVTGSVVGELNPQEDSNGIVDSIV